MTDRKTAPKSKAPAKGKASAPTSPAKPAPKAAEPATKAAPAKAAEAEKPVQTAAKAGETAVTEVKKTQAATQDAAAKTIQEGSNTMANTTEKMTDKTTDMVNNMSERAKAASEKTTQMMSQAGEFGRGNVEAFVQAGKIGAEGMQEIGRDNMEFAKKNFEDASSAMKDFTSVKSPTELFQLQGEYARKNFDVMVEQSSKNTEKMVKLWGDMFQPISSRMAEAGEKMKIEA
ncbi:phasin family protein [Novosphingopyxis iocasae]|uniref:phasin family protein n=1 Tax=Novosphingopyxis iocasae TaxID=2762729 RepID=UPI0016511D1E|nr:phasin family protein [Novosphingopyxis iocasae]